MRRMGRRFTRSATIGLGVVAMTTSGAGIGILVASGTPAGASSGIIGSCRAVLSRAGTVETLVANPRGNPCVPDDQGNHLQTIPIPGINGAVEIVGPESITDAYRTPDSSTNRAGVIAHAVIVRVNGVDVFYTIDMQDSVDTDLEGCTEKTPIGVTELGVVVLGPAVLSDFEAPLTIPLAPGVRMHLNWRQQSGNSMTVRGMWIENLPSTTVNIVVGEAHASIDCLIGD